MMNVISFVRDTSVKASVITYFYLSVYNRYDTTQMRFVSL